ncbi:DoxX family membrane protein [bacterium]|nr:DoxX family membrane protein [bacterium]
MIIDPFLPFMLRVILGSLFFFQAYDKLFRIGLQKNYHVYEEDCRKRKVPLSFMKISVLFSSYIELLGGLFLMIGVFQHFTLLLLGLNLIMVSVGLGFLQGLWDLRHVFPRLILLTLIYLIPKENDTWNFHTLFNMF